MNLSAVRYGGPAPPARPPIADYTILYYMNGDNDLREHVTTNLVRLNEAGAGAGTQVAAALFRGDWVWSRKNLARKLEEIMSPKPPPAVVPDWRGRKVYVVRHRDTNEQTREVAAPGGDLPSHPGSLQAFVNWGVRAFPAKHTLLVVSGHGSGHRGILCDRNGNRMSIPDLASSLEGAQKDSGVKLDGLVLEGCCMGQVEVAYQLRHTADVLLVSPEPLNNTAPHNRLLDLLADGGSKMSPRDLIGRITSSDFIKDYAPSITAVDLSKMDAVMQSAQALGPKLINTPTPQAELRELHDHARVYGPDFKSREMVDLGNLVNGLITDAKVPDADLKAAAKDLQSVVQSAIIAHRDNVEPDRTGLSIYVPTGRPDKEYAQLEFPRNSGWGAYLTHPRRSQ